jgi:hypothetical protein
MMKYLVVQKRSFHLKSHYRIERSRCVAGLIAALISPHRSKRAQDFIRAATIPPDSGWTAHDAGVIEYAPCVWRPA